MNVSRRKLLATGSIAAAAGLAGCIGGPQERTALEATVAEPFDTAAPMTVPVTVDVYVQNVNSNAVGLRNVELVCYDVAREELTRERLGDFSWEDAAPERRESEDHDSGFGSVTVYSAEWTLETSVSVERVPEWITFHVGEVWFEDDEVEAHSQGAIVGTARASQPPPPLTVTIGRFASERPPSNSVSPDEYERSRVSPRLPIDKPLLPNPDTAQFWHARRNEQRARLEADIDAFIEDSMYGVAPSAIDDPWEETIDALEDDRSDGPHLVEGPHTVAADLDERGLLSDQRTVLEVQPQDAFVDRATEVVTAGERIVGLPSGLHTIALLYNRDLVATPPETVAELTAIMDDYHDPENGTYGIEYPLSSPDYYRPWIHAFGGYYYDEESDSVGLTEPETIRGFEFVVDSLFPFVADVPYRSDDPEDVFVAGNAPFAIDGPNLAARAAANGIDIGVTPLPKLDATERPPSPFVTVDLLSFTSQLTDPDGRDATATATTFAEWYATNEDVQVRNAREYGAIPVCKGAIEHDDLPEPTAGFVDSAAMGELAPSLVEMWSIYQPLQAAFETVLAGEQSASTALEQAEREIESGF
ncbi:extracellular solute-binding protein [Natronorubrum sp. FCH18a]|uniref:extracellular solute-binding protein n=1 Tax=Natronorubrum sp. FCH18a TaxID=3447018 RepID=UPI003F510198